MARLVADASGAPAQGLREAERYRPDRGIFRGARLGGASFFSLSPAPSSFSLSVRPALSASSGIGCRICRCRTFALRSSPCSVIPERLRLTRRKSHPVRLLFSPAARYAAVPIRPGYAGRPRPADCPRSCLPNSGRRLRTVDVSKRLPPPGCGGRFAASVAVRNVFSALASVLRPRPPVGRSEKSPQIGGKGAKTAALSENLPGGCDFPRAGVA